MVRPIDPSIRTSTESTNQNQETKVGKEGSREVKQLPTRGSKFQLRETSRSNSAYSSPSSVDTSRKTDEKSIGIFSKLKDFLGIGKTKNTSPRNINKSNNDRRISRDVTKNIGNSNNEEHENSLEDNDLDNRLKNDGYRDDHFG